METVKKDNIQKPIKKKKSKCYTCFPERKVLKHIIKEIDDMTFHHDMHNRNMIIVTPKKHYNTLKDFLDTELVSFFRNIDEFCAHWNLNDYSLSFNHGEWQTHDHFHAKIKILEKTANRMRGDHFRLYKLMRTYDNLS